MVQSRLNFYKNFYNFKENNSILYFIIDAKFLKTKHIKKIGKIYYNNDYLINSKKNSFNIKRLEIKKIFKHNTINNVIKI